MKFIKFISHKTPADGSCFFHAISKAIERINKISTTKIRETVSQEIINNDKYQKMIYPANIEKYIDWIKKPDSWGGEPEIIILSEFFNLNIIVGVVETKEVLKFGKENENVIFLIYYGGHYDLAVIEFEIKYNENTIKEIFNLIIKQVDCEDMDFLIKKFEEFIGELNKKFDFLDIKNYHIYCVDCGCMFTLETEFQEHKEKHKHTSFAKIENMNLD